MTVTTRGIVATSVTLASQAGAQILARGGNAVDAAIAANATLGVVEPMMNGIGGDLFAIVRMAGDTQPRGLNASGWAPAGLTIDVLKKSGEKTMPPYGIHTVTVPGCVAGWAALHAKYGKLPWKDLFQPAIYYAEKGYPVAEVVHGEWVASLAKLKEDDYARRTFLPEGRAPGVGEVFRNPDLARSLRLIADTGAPAFYRGAISQALLARSTEMHGTMNAADLAEFQPEWVEPISTTYRGWSVYEIPPNSQGIAALEMLNLMERFDLGKMGFTSPEAFHLKIEAEKLAYMDLARWVGDPRFAKIPVAGLLDKQYAAQAGHRSGEGELPAGVRRSFAAGEGRHDLPVGGGCRRKPRVADPEHFSIVRESALRCRGTGFICTIEGRCSCCSRSTRMRWRLASARFTRSFRDTWRRATQRIAFGIMGGLNQAQAHAQFVSDIADHGMNIQAAMEAPRFRKLTFGGCDLKIEPRLPAATLERLRAMGHQLTLTGDFSHLEMGCGQAVLLDTKSGVKFGASDPRKDGAAVPEPDPYFQKR